MDSLTRGFAGSTAAQTAHAFRVDRNGRGLRPIDRRRILVPLDGTDASYDVLRTAVASAGADASAVHALIVLDEFETDAAHIRQVLAPDCREDRETTSQERRLQELGIEGVEVVVRTGPRVETIRAMAEEVDSDLIMMPADRTPLLRRIFSGAVTERVVREAPCPVLVL